MNSSTPPAAPRQWRILIVEDEPMLACFLEELLVAAGYEVAGVASRLEAALAIIAGGSCDAATLDTNLAGVSAAAAAAALASRGIPFLVLSGYAPDQLDKAFAAAVHLQKPCRPDRILQALQSILPNP